MPRPRASAMQANRAVAHRGSGLPNMPNTTPAMAIRMSLVVTCRWETAARATSHTIAVQHCAQWSGEGGGQGYSLPGVPRLPPGSSEQ